MKNKVKVMVVLAFCFVFGSVPSVQADCVISLKTGWLSRPGQQVAIGSHVLTLTKDRKATLDGQKVDSGIILHNSFYLIRVWADGPYLKYRGLIYEDCSR